MIRKSTKFLLKLNDSFCRIDSPSTVGLFIIMLGFLVFTTSCQFKKKDFVDETQEKVKELSEDAAKRNAEIEKGQLITSDVKLDFEDGPEYGQYVGVFELPSKVTRINFSVYELDEKTKDSWKEIVPNTTIVGNRGTFNAKAELKYRLIVSSLTGIGSGNPVQTEKLAPSDVLIDENTTYTQEMADKTSSYQRIFLREGVILFLEGAAVKISPKKIIAGRNSQISNRNSSLGELDNYGQTNLTIEVDEIIGSLVVNMKGASAKRARSGDELFNAMKFKIAHMEQPVLDHTESQIIEQVRQMLIAPKDGQDGSDGESIIESNCKRTKFDGEICNPQKLCMSQPTSGEAGGNGYDGLDGENGYRGNFTGNLALIIKKSMARGTVEVFMRPGSGSIPSMGGTAIPNGKDGRPGKIIGPGDACHPVQAVKNQHVVKNGKCGRPGPAGSYGHVTKILAEKNEASLITVTQLPAIDALSMMTKEELDACGF